MVPQWDNKTIIRMANDQNPQYMGTLDLEGGVMERVKEGEEPPVVTPGEEPPATPPVETPPAGGQPVDYLKSLSEKAGLQFQTDDEIINEIKAVRALKEKVTDYENKLKNYSELDDPMVRDIARAKKAGIGLDLYLEARKMEPEKLDDKRALKEDFIRKKADLFATDPDYINQLFEREFKAKYGKLSEKLDIAGLDEVEAQQKTVEFNTERDFVEKSLKADATLAKKSLNEWKKQHITIPDVPQEQAMTDQQIQEHKTRVDSFVALNEKIEIPIGDKKFNFGLKDYAETLKTELLNPLDTLKKHGVDIIGGNIDINKLGKLLTSAYVAENIGKPLSDWSIEARNLEYLKNKKESPAPSQSTAGGALPGEEDDLTRIGKGLRAQMEARSQS